MWRGGAALVVFPCILAACAAIALGISPAQSSEGTFRMASLTLEGSSNPVPGLGDQWIGPVDKKPEHVKVASEQLDDGSKWFCANILGEQLWMVVEPKSLKLYVDTDMDEDLTDEEVIEGEEGEDQFIRMGTAMLRTPEGKDKSRVRIGFHTGDDGIDFAVVSPASARTGEMPVGMVNRRVILIDTTLNGCFNDAYAQDNPYDHIAIDFDGDGSINPWTEIMPLPSLTVFDNVVLSVSVRPDGSGVTLREAHVPTGTLSTAPEAMFTLLSDTGVIRLHAGDGPWTVPAGKYRVSNLELIEYDKDRSYWTTGCLSPNKAEWVEIAEGKTNSFKIGTPLTFHTSVSEEDGKTVVNLELLGQGGERYFPYPRTNAQGVPGAKVSILDEEGAELASGGIEYG